MRQSNFRFLEDICPDALECLVKAEKYYSIHNDEQIILDLLRYSINHMVNYIIKFEGIDYQDTLFRKLQKLEYDDSIPSEILNIMHKIRMDRNSTNYNNTELNKNILFYFEGVFTVSKWFYYKYKGSRDYPNEFISPKDFESKTSNNEKEKYYKNDQDDNNLANKNSLISMSKKYAIDKVSSNEINKRNNRSLEVISELSYEIDKFNFIYEQRTENLDDIIEIDAEDIEYVTENKQKIVNKMSLILIGLILLSTFTIVLYAEEIIKFPFDDKKIINDEKNEENLYSESNTISKGEKEKSLPNTSNDDKLIDSTEKINEDVEVTNDQQITEDIGKKETEKKVSSGENKVEELTDKNDDIQDDSLSEEENVKSSNTETNLNNEEYSIIEESADSESDTSDNEVTVNNNPELNENNIVEEENKDLENSNVQILDIITNFSSPQELGKKIKLIPELNEKYDNKYIYSIRKITQDKWQQLGSTYENGLVWTPMTSGNFVIKVSIYDSSENVISDYSLEYEIKEKPEGIIYFINQDNKLYSMDTNGEYLKKLTEDEVNNIKIEDEWIYFINNSKNNNLYKISKDGKMKIKITDYSINSYEITKNYIYYSKGDYSKIIIYQISKNGESKRTLTDGVEKGNIRNFVASNDTVYFNLDHVYGGIYKLNALSKEISLIYSGKIDMENMILKDDWIYYNYDKEIRRLKIDGSSRMDIVIGNSGFDIEDDWIYAGPPYLGEYLYRSKIDGSRKEVIIIGSTIRLVDATKNWIYFTKINRPIAKVKIGSDKTVKINDIIPKEFIVEVTK